MADQDSDYQGSTSLRALFHDLGNHLATFACMLDAVEGDRGMSPTAHSNVAMMRAQTARMLALLRDAVDQDARPEIVDARELVQEIVAMANARREAVVTAPPGHPERLCSHPAAMWRAVANVVDNAVRAAGPDGQVTVTVRRGGPVAAAAGSDGAGHGAPVVVEVVDDGPGFGNIAPGSASLGLEIAGSLLRKCAGTLDIAPGQPRGVRVRMAFPDLSPASPGGG